MQKIADELRKNGKRIGFVPTMGFLHEGHLSLIDIVNKNSVVSVMSIFVNPTQFAPHEDFDSYPRNFERDEQLAKERGCDIVFYPKKEEMYQSPYRTYVLVNEITSGLCGASRPTFFRGVATVVTKLFNIVKPHVAVFGQKDAQQAFVIRQIIKDLNMDLDILVGPIVRENDGLAMSSRNKYLSNQERKDALVLHQSLVKAERMAERGNINSKNIQIEIKNQIQFISSAKIDYIEIVNTNNFRQVKKLNGEILIALAVWIGKTRLIDNVIINI